MSRRLAFGLIAGGVVFSAATGAWAQPRPKAAPPPVHGAVVIAIGDDATPAAAPLAREIYKDPGMRPQIDDGTARVLAGDPVPESAPASLKDLAEVRAAIPRGAPDASARRLIAAIGNETHAVVVVAVEVSGGRAVARLVRVDDASVQRPELGATANEGGAYAWPSALTAIRPLVRAATPPPPATTEETEPRAPPKKPEDDKPIYRSPWFWVATGTLVALGAAIAIGSQVNRADPTTVHVTGRIGP